MGDREQGTAGRAAGASSSRSGMSFVILVLGLGTACTLGPEPRRPDTVVEDAPSFLGSAEERGIASRSEADGAWWRHTGDPEIGRLVEQALAGNTDLAVAAARVLEAEAQLRKAGGARWPRVTAGVGGSRVKNSFVLPTIGRTEIYSTNFTSDLSVTYIADVFGKLRRTRQSAWASVLASEAAREALEQAVIAAVVRSRVAIASLERAVEISDEIRASWEKTLETVERRYRGGLAGTVDLYLARENLSATQAAGVSLRGRLATARHALDVLVGRRPGSDAASTASVPELPDPDPLPLGVPADLLEQRPDIRQAEMQLAAATYGVGIAIADLFPSLTLSASAGVVGDSLSDLTSSEGVVYNAVANLVSPVFNHGQRRADVDAARARVEQASAQYAGTVLNALREVEDALVEETSGRQRLQYLERRLQEARAAQRVARERYQRGVESLLKVLETERRLRAAEDALLSTRADLWNARIDLHLALGGDWKSENESAGPPAAAGSSNEQRPAERADSEVMASPEVLR